MDDRYRIPGTNIRFGLDSVIGLIPGVGDASGLALGAVPVLAAQRLGTSRRLKALMLRNLMIDSIAGMVPVLGDAFDLMFRANRRNLELLREHIEEGKHQGGSLRVIIPLVLGTVMVIIAILWCAFGMINWIKGWQL